jgi:hypothetical protein
MAATATPTPKKGMSFSVESRSEVQLVRQPLFAEKSNCRYDLSAARTTSFITCYKRLRKESNTPLMALSLDKPKLDNLANEIWKSAERLRGKFKPYEYQNVILPIIVIRRLECVLLKWRAEKKEEIQAKPPKRTEKELDALVKKLELNPQQCPFSNKTTWTLRKIYEEDHTLLEDN